MGLADAQVGATIPVSDMGRALEFYEGKLGLSGGVDQGDGGRTFTLGGGTRLHVYPSPDNAGKSGATLAAFSVGDIGSMVDELTGKGVRFEQYGEPFNTDERGIARLGGDLEGAWFRDPDGNTLGIANA